MNGYNFTRRVRRALQAAREEANALGNAFVGPEHMLLGLIREGDGTAIAVLAACTIDLAHLKSDLQGIMRGRGDTSKDIGPDLPYTAYAKRALELAMHAARELHHGHVGTEHLLLGLLADEQSDASRLLRAAGATSEVVRAHVLRLGMDEDNAPPRERADRHPQPSITVLLDYGGERVIAKKFSSSDDARRFFEELST
jgi:ATP-dependent Clp protease ATP-binding subunit ClpC